MSENYDPPSWGDGDTFEAEQASEMAQQIDEEEGINISQVAQIAALQARVTPSAFLDPSTRTDGPITSLTSGQFGSVFGNALLRFEGGRIVHSAGAIAAGNIAGYLQAKMVNPVTRIGAIAYWPSGSATAVVCLALSKNPGWDNPIGTGVNSDAPVHVTMNGAGQINASRYQISDGSLQNQHNARQIVSAFTGRSHVLEVFLIHAENRVVVALDGLKYCDFVDASFFSDVAPYPIWELFGPYNTPPAQLLSVWADDLDLVPVPSPPVSLAGMPVGMMEPAVTSDSTTATFTTTAAAVGAYESVGTFCYPHVFHIPESGKVLLRASFWATVTGGDMLVRFLSAGGVRVAKAGFDGRVIAEQLYTGTPGTAVSMTMQVYLTAGSALLIKGGAHGPAIIQSIPVR